MATMKKGPGGSHGMDGHYNLVAAMILYGGPDVRVRDNLCWRSFPAVASQDERYE